MRFLLIASLLFCMPLLADQEIDVKKVSETYGHLIGKNLRNPGFTFDLDSVVRGLREEAAGQPAPLSEPDYLRAIAQIEEQIYETTAADNLSKANAFLTQNGSVAGIVTIAGGKVQYRTEQAGDGSLVAEHASPSLHYTGAYLDGKVFGSTEDTQESIVLPLDDTIPGFAQGVLGMREGEKRRIYVHPDLGYGKSMHLPPNSLLVFDVEIVKANEKISESPSWVTSPLTDEDRKSVV